MSDWPELERFLQTDPRDVGCDRAMEVLHVYVELVLAGEDAARRHPGVAAHLAACGPCSEDFEGLLAAVRDGAATSRLRRAARRLWPARRRAPRG